MHGGLGDTEPPCGRGSRVPEGKVRGGLEFVAEVADNIAPVRRDDAAVSILGAEVHVPAGDLSAGDDVEHVAGGVKGDVVGAVKDLVGVVVGLSGGVVRLRSGLLGLRGGATEGVNEGNVSRGCGVGHDANIADFIGRSAAPVDDAARGQTEIERFSAHEISIRHVPYLDALAGIAQQLRVIRRERQTHQPITTRKTGV